MATRTYAVTDRTQPDAPRYELKLSPSALRRGFVYDGSALDTLTDRTVRVHFSFVRPGRIAGFRGPSADTTQPPFPIRAAFYYAWYPEAWWRDPVFPYSNFHPSLDYYSAADARVAHDHTAALRYAHLQAGIYSWWGRTATRRRICGSGATSPPRGQHRSAGRSTTNARAMTTRASTRSATTSSTSASPTRPSPRT